MADISIEVVKAQNWIKRVKEEIGITERTLGEVRTLCSSPVGEDDTIVMCLEESGKMMEDAWSQTTGTFKKAWNLLEEGIDKLAQSGQEIQEGFESLKAEIR